jgi:N-carbamoyl-L-amino-acid hydrolase
MSFDPALVGLLDAAARRRDLACRRLTASGAHDARMMARICPSAMVLVPASRSGGGGADDAEPADLAAGAGVLAEAMRSLGEA